MLLELHFQVSSKVQKVPHSNSTNDLMLARVSIPLLQRNNQLIPSSPMALLPQFHHSLIISWILFVATTVTSMDFPKPYIVYMGSSSSDIGADTSERSAEDHLQLLSSIIPREESDRVALIRHFSYALRGFSALLTESEASVLSGQEGVVSVFPDPTLQLHTTRSWDFLETRVGTWTSGFPASQHVSGDVIIGLIDTGIWPESSSFRDEGIGKIPLKWKGVCMEGPDFKKFNCNRKLIGARYYDIHVTSDGNRTSRIETKGSPRDSVGHGTHTASIAAGNKVPNASYYGLAQGTTRGGSPSARIAVYKACTPEGCSGSVILKAMDDAIRDGVDIISISIGMNSLFQSDYISDPIAIGALHAEEKGVMVVCSAGNDGPDPYTVVNTAPWIITVAASTIDRAFQSTIVLGNGRSFQGSAINFSNLTRSRMYPLVFAQDVAANFTPPSEASNCYPGSLDYKKVPGKIVVCLDNDSTVSRRIKMLVVQDAKAKGMILINEDDKGVPLDAGSFPFTQVGNIEGDQILKYMNSTRNPAATILSTTEILGHKPAPEVAYFSSRGPGQLTENILKPDIMAPGVAILASFVPKSIEPGSVPAGKRPSGFTIRSGTSMACPHVAGAASFIKSMHYGWSSSMIRSALMTTALPFNNMKKPLTNSSNYMASPHDAGVGEINPLSALSPGLVYETTQEDYLLFLCYNGYTDKKIRSISNPHFSCPKNSSEDLISNVNYPSISISKLDRHKKPVVIKRTVRNVGSPNATYTAKVYSPLGLAVKVLPEKLVFSGGVREASFQVAFSGKEAEVGYHFGSLTWFDGRHSVRTIFAINVV